MFKRLFDIIISSIALVVLSPILIVISIKVVKNFGRPILFTQKRPGLGGHIFKMIKFRSMSDEKDSNGELLPDDKRLTRFGLTLRSTSLDELPGLWNVLKGNMSLVGPRPLLVEYLPLYSDRQSKRHALKPGITGWAQINGRNTISWEDKFELDVWYVENQNFWLDIKILLLTVIKIVKKEDIEHSTIEELARFRGNKN